MLSDPNQIGTIHSCDRLGRVQHKRQVTANRHSIFYLKVSDQYQISCVQSFAVFYHSDRRISFQLGLLLEPCYLKMKRA